MTKLNQHYCILILQLLDQIKEAMVKTFSSEFERQDMCIRGFDLTLGPYRIDLLPQVDLTFQFGPVTVIFSK